MNEILKTLCQQIGMNKLAVMVGATHMTYDNDKNQINFKFKMNTKMNHCSIQYNYAGDDYTMTFYKIGSKSFKEIKVIEGLYFDQLNCTFEETTGLATHL